MVAEFVDAFPNFQYHFVSQMMQSSGSVGADWAHTIMRIVHPSVLRGRRYD